MLISNRLIGLRDKENISITDLAKKFGIDRKTIWRAETEQYIPKTEVLIMYAKYFDVSLDYICGLIDNPEPISTRKKRKSL